MRDESIELVRKYDRNRYLAALFASDDRRRDLLSLYAFHVELIRIRSTVTDPQIGMIRLQWWRDTISAIYAKESVDHPVAREFGEVIKRYSLPEAPLQAKIDAHTADLFSDPMPDQTALEGYLGETESAVIQLACMILDGAAAPSVAQAAGYCGVANGIVRVLQSVPQLIPTHMAAPETILSLSEKRWADFVKEKLAGSVAPAFRHTADTLRQIKALRKNRRISPLLSQWDIWRWRPA